jgi:light-harvesting complex 1 beta chain
MYPVAQTRAAASAQPVWRPTQWLGSNLPPQHRPAARRVLRRSLSSRSSSRKSVSGLTPEQAKEFHEQFKVTYTAFVGIAALVHLFVIASNPWF